MRYQLAYSIRRSGHFQEHICLLPLVSPVRFDVIHLHEEAAPFPVCNYWVLVLTSRFDVTKLFGTAGILWIGRRLSPTPMNLSDPT